MVRKCLHVLSFHTMRCRYNPSLTDDDTTAEMTVGRLATHGYLYKTVRQASTEIRGIFGSFSAKYIHSTCGRTDECEVPHIILTTVKSIDSKEHWNPHENEGDEVLPLGHSSCSRLVTAMGLAD